MQRNAKSVAILTAGALSLALALLLPGGVVEAADTRTTDPTKSGLPGGAPSGLVPPSTDYQANYHADYSVKGTQSGEEANTRDTRDWRNEQRDDRHDREVWRTPASQDRFGRPGFSWPRP